MCHEFVGRGIEVGGDQRDAEHVEESGPVVRGAAGDDEDVGAELGECVGSGEPGHPEAEYGHPQPRPVRVPAGEPVERAVRGRAGCVRVGVRAH